MRFVLVLVATMAGGCASIAAIDDVTYLSPEAGRGEDHADVGADVMSQSDTGVADDVGVGADVGVAATDAGDGHDRGADAALVCAMSGAACGASGECCSGLVCVEGGRCSAGTCLPPRSICGAVSACCVRSWCDVPGTGQCVDCKPTGASCRTNSQCCSLACLATVCT